VPQNKRRRTSDESSLQRTPPSGRDDSPTPSTPPSDFNTDDEQADVAATQALRAKAAENKRRGNEPADYGILEGVELKNFMCHQSMTFKLGPLINFICGKNGSGKSAILTAITLCLGGKASATNRGARLQDFIKEGQDHASITCYIKNQGENAYKPEDYGNTIQVERHFSRAGGSGFKLKSEKGRIISTRKMDLEDILDHMMMQFDNPMSVLSQDQARQFLASSAASEKYKLFMKGVQLEQLDQDYRLIEEQSENIKVKVATKAPDLEDLRKAMESANTKLELSQKHDSTLAKMREYRRLLAWIQVEQQEKIRDNYIQAITEADAKIADAEHKAGQLDEVYQAADGEATNANHNYDLAKAEVDTVEEEKREEKARHDEIKKATVEAHTEQRTIRTELKAAEAIINTKKQEIQEEMNRLADLNGGGAAARVQALQEAEQTLNSARMDEKEHADKRPELQANVKTLEKLFEEADQAKTSQMERVKQQTQILGQMNRNRNSQDLAFHQNMPHLLNAIQHETNFQHRPIGPLGKHVKLLKPEWSSILEKSFGSTMNAFLVSNKRDEKLLSDIMRRTKCPLPIYIGNNQPIEVTNHEPDARFDTILRVLEIDNEAVKKQLVIAHNIEQAILISDMAEASETLYSSGQPLRNVKRCFCFSPNTRLRGAVLFYRGGQPAQDPVHQFQGSPRMRTDIDESIRRQDEAVDESKTQLHQLENEFHNARERHVKAQQSLTRHGRDSVQLRIAVQRAQDEVEQLRDAIKEDNVEGGKLDALRDAQAEAEEKKALHASSYQDSVTVLDEAKQKLRAATQKLSDLDERIANLQATANDAQAVAQKAGKKRAYTLGEKNAAIARIDDAKSDRETMERKLEEMNGDIDNWTEQARAVSERVNIPPGLTYDALDKKYRRLGKDYAAFEKNLGGSKEQIAARAAECSEGYNRAQQEMKDMEKLLDKLLESLGERKSRWKLFRSLISHRIKIQFMYMLSERGFRGRVVMDHKQKMMEIQVEPDITTRDGNGRGVRTLSGGEKSFTQICLLLAIWEAMGSPVRCLDEFDVFMDAVNRTISVNLLIEGARQSIGKQFILISPGTKSDIKRAPDVNAIE
jgi:chromosome segregation ATPase